MTQDYITSVAEVRGEPLHGPGRPMWRFRVGDYRVLYVFKPEEVQ